MDFRSLTIRPASFEDVDYVVRRMRPSDREEIFPLRFSGDDDSLINDIVATAMHGACAFFYAVARRHVARPIAILQLVLITPVAGGITMFATPDWRMIVGDFTRFVRNVFIPDCMKAGLLRVEVRALAAWTQNVRWLESLGAVRECEVKGFAPQPFVQLAWTRKEPEPCA